MKCIHCKKELRPGDDYKLHGCDGDFIHTACEAPYRAEMDAFFAPGGPGSSKESLTAWLFGEGTQKDHPSRT